MSGNICALYSLRRGGRYSAPHRSVPTLVLGVTRIHEVVKLLLLLLWMPRPGPGLADRACGDGGMWRPRRPRPGRISPPI